MSNPLIATLYQLTKEDEAAAGDEVEVRREDQDKINKFSRLHQRELKIEEELKVKNVCAVPEEMSQTSPEVGSSKEAIIG